MKNIFSLSISEIKELLSKQEITEELDLDGIERLGFFKRKITPRSALQAVLEYKKKMGEKEQIERASKSSRLSEINMRLNEINSKIDNLEESLKLIYVTFCQICDKIDRLKEKE